MKTGRAVALVLVCFTSLSSFQDSVRADATPQRAIDLRQVARWAATQPPAVVVAARRVAAADARASVARAAYAPTLTMEAELEAVRQRQTYFAENRPNQRSDGEAVRANGGARLDYTLFDFRARRYRVEQADSDRALARQGTVGARFESIRSACELYVDLLTTQQLRDNAAISSARRASISRAISQLIDAGLRPRVDLQRAEVEALAARTELTVLEAQLAKQSASLATAMGFDPNTVLTAAELDETLLDLSDAVGDVERRTLARPEVESERARINANRAASRAARAARYPSLHAYATVNAQHAAWYDGTGMGNTFVLLGGLSLQWRALDLGVVREVGAVDAELGLSLASLSAVVLNARGNAQVRRREVTRAKEALDQAAQILQAAAIARDAQNRRYQSGEASLMELLDAEGIEQDARSRRILAQRDLTLARVTLLDAIGVLERQLVP